MEQGRTSDGENHRRGVARDERFRRRRRPGWQTIDLGGGGAQYRLSNDEGASLLLRCERGVVSAGFEFPAPVNARGRAVLRAIPGEQRNLAVRPVGERLLQLTGGAALDAFLGLLSLPATASLRVRTGGEQAAFTVFGSESVARVPPAAGEGARAAGARGVGPVRLGGSAGAPARTPRSRESIPAVRRASHGARAGARLPGGLRRRPGIGAARRERSGRPSSGGLSSRAGGAAP